MSDGQNGNGGPATAIVRQIHTGERGLVLRSLDDLWRFAICVHKSGLAPKGLGTVEAVACALQYGAEVGLAPMSALKNVYVVNGRPELWGDGFRGVVTSIPEFDWERYSVEFSGDGEARTATVSMGRKGVNRTWSRSFSVADAKRAGLAGKETYKAFPDDMLSHRAFARVAKDVFPAQLAGLGGPDESEPVDLPVVRPVLTEPRAIGERPADPDVIGLPAGMPEVDASARITPAQLEAFRSAAVNGGKSIKEITEYVRSVGAAKSADLTVGQYDAAMAWATAEPVAA